MLRRWKIHVERRDIAHGYIVVEDEDPKVARETALELAQRNFDLHVTKTYDEHNISTNIIIPLP